MNTSIVFPEWEEIIDMNLGDDVSFKVSRQAKRKNALVIAPDGGITGADTSLTVFGKSVNGASTGEPAPWGASEGGRNVYSFILVSLPGKSDKLANVIVQVKTSRPGFTHGMRSFPEAETVTAVNVDRAAVDKQQAMRAGTSPNSSEGKPVTERPEWLREIPFDMSQLRFNDYQVRVQEGEEAAGIAPVRVFHDGVFTYLDFGEGDGGRSDRMLKPVIRQVIDEIDTKVNIRVTGPTDNIFVIEAIGDFTLRNGSRVVCVDYIGDRLPIKPAGEVTRLQTSRNETRRPSLPSADNN